MTNKKIFPLSIVSVFIIGILFYIIFLLAFQNSDKKNEETLSDFSILFQYFSRDPEEIKTVLSDMQNTSQKIINVGYNKTPEYQWSKFFMSPNGQYLIRWNDYHIFISENTAMENLEEIVTAEGPYNTISDILFFPNHQKILYAVTRFSTSERNYFENDTQISLYTVNIDGSENMLLSTYEKNNPHTLKLRGVDLEKNELYWTEFVDGGTEKNYTIADLSDGHIKEIQEGFLESPISVKPPINEPNFQDLVVKSTSPDGRYIWLEREREYFIFDTLNSKLSLFFSSKKDEKDTPMESIEFIGWVRENNPNQTDLNNPPTIKQYFFLSSRKNNFIPSFLLEKSSSEDIPNPKFAVSSNGEYIVRWEKYRIQISDAQNIKDIKESTPVVIIEDKKEEIQDVMFSEDGSAMIYTTTRILNPVDPFSDIDGKIYLWSTTAKNIVLLSNFSYADYLVPITIDSLRQEVYLVRRTNDSLENFTIMHLDKNKTKESVPFISPGTYSSIKVSHGKVYFHSTKCEFIEYDLDQKKSRIIFGLNQNVEICQMNFLVSPDGNTLLLSFFDFEKWGSSIFKLELSKMPVEESLVFSSVGQVFLNSWSPDNKYVFLQSDPTQKSDISQRPHILHVFDLQKNEVFDFSEEFLSVEGEKTRDISFIGWVNHP